MNWLSLPSQVGDRNDTVCLLPRAISSPLAHLSAVAIWKVLLPNFEPSGAKQQKHLVTKFAREGLSRMTKNKIIEQSQLTENRMKCDSFSSAQRGLLQKVTGLTPFLPAMVLLPGPAKLCAYPPIAWGNSRLLLLRTDRQIQTHLFQRPVQFNRTHSVCAMKILKELMRTPIKRVESWALTPWTLVSPAQAYLLWNNSWMRLFSTVYNALDEIYCPCYAADQTGWS